VLLDTVKFIVKSISHLIFTSLRCWGWLKSNYLDFFFFKLFLNEKAECRFGNHSENHILKNYMNNY